MADQAGNAINLKIESRAAIEDESRIKVISESAANRAGPQGAMWIEVPCSLRHVVATEFADRGGQFSSWASIARLYTTW